MRKRLVVFLLILSQPYCASAPTPPPMPEHAGPDTYYISGNVRDTDYICMGIGAIQHCATAREVRMFLMSLRAEQ